jgi:hypothetical protein
MSDNKTLFLIEGLEAVVILLLAFYLYKLHREMGTLTRPIEEPVEE